MSVIFRVMGGSGERLSCYGEGRRIRVRVVVFRVRVVVFRVRVVVCTVRDLILRVVGRRERFIWVSDWGWQEFSASHPSSAPEDLK